jgi:cytochrome o ubiquinol oxidase subunit 2
MTYATRPCRRLAAVCPLLPLTLLGGCDMVVLNPLGDVARQQGNLVIIATLLMLLVIVPVMTLTAIFAWRYRASNREAEYRPEWSHSTQLELVIWAAPLMIIIALGAITWISTHLLDPYRPLAQIAPGKPITASSQKPLEIQVVSLDWKWLFIYPEQGIATVNALALPVDRQVRFSLTSSNVMNAFYVPTLAGMIYTMPGMETKLHAVLNKPGRFEGISANYSGAGFSDMRFAVEGMDGAAFERWAAGVRSSGKALDAGEYARLEKPSEKVPVIRYGTIAPGLFTRIVGMCALPGQSCTAHGHGGHGMPMPAQGEPASHDMPGMAGAPEQEGHPGHENMTHDQTRQRPGASASAHS